MTHPQNSGQARGARDNENPTDLVRGGPSDDPQLREMLTSHIHCGQPMQPVTVDMAPLEESRGGGLLTYRCACGFCFDQRQD